MDNTMKLPTRINDVGISGYNHSFDQFPNHHLGDPCELIYRSKTPVLLSDISPHLFLAHTQKMTTFPSLGVGLKLSLCGVPNVGNDEVESLTRFFDKDTCFSTGRGTLSMQLIDLTRLRIH
jgi:hypothetical protein